MILSVEDQDRNKLTSERLSALASQVGKNFKGISAGIPIVQSPVSIYKRLVQTINDIRHR